MTIEELNSQVTKLSEELSLMKGTIFYCVCEFCNHHEQKARIEFNFRDKTVFYLCTSCKKMNKMVLKNEIRPYPKSRTGLA